MGGGGGGGEGGWGRGREHIAFGSFVCLSDHST